MRETIFDGLPPSEAVRRAWNDPEPRADIQIEARREVAERMPALARALNWLVGASAEEYITAAAVRMHAHTTGQDWELLGHLERRFWLTLAAEAHRAMVEIDDYP